jgi:formylmethanofuran:tetrahydromethanopterin formyltransferase
MVFACRGWILVARLVVVEHANGMQREQILLRAQRADSKFRERLNYKVRLNRMGSPISPGYLSGDAKQVTYEMEIRLRSCCEGCEMSIFHIGRQVSSVKICAFRFAFPRGVLLDDGWGKARQHYFQYRGHFRLTKLHDGFRRKFFRLAS